MATPRRLRLPERHRGEGGTNGPNLPVEIRIAEAREPIRHALVTGALEEAIEAVPVAGDDSVSRLEQRSDLLISTLRGYVEAMGGRLSLIAEFPNQDPVVLAGLAAIESAKTDG